MTKSELIAEIKRKKSFLCVGLDPDLDKIPEHYKQFEDPIFEFNKDVIDATNKYAVAYKPNTAFYECHGAAGWETLRKTIDYIPKDCLIIADAKRGDIGNTSTYYAKTFFETLNCDAITVAPYMGEDSVKPFLAFKDKWVITLVMTSNLGAKDFQFLNDGDGKKIFQHVIQKSNEWGTDENTMFVVGATRTEQIAEVRNMAPNHFFLVPGVGAQGGSIDDVVKFGWSKENCGLLINSSRAILYADSNTKVGAEKEAHKLQQEMEAILLQKAF